MPNIRWTGGDALSVIDAMKDLSANYDKIYVLIPTEVSGSNYDPFEDSSLDPTNTSTEETGQTVTWKVQIIYARLGGPTFTDFLMAENVGYEKGDINLFIKKTDLYAINAVLQDKLAYLVANGERYRPFGTADPSGVFGAYEYIVNCHSITPVVTATGY